MSSNGDSLLAQDEPPAVTEVNPGGRSPFVLVCEHASNRIPRQLGDLGLNALERERHIAWDIGIAEVARRMAAVLDAPLLLQNYSRLVCDCNRAETDSDFIVEVSDGVLVPGNQGLSHIGRALRIGSIYRPFHDRVAGVLDDRASHGIDTMVVAMHSFTPELGGIRRPWHVGILYERPMPVVSAVLGCLRRQPELNVGDNEPYSLLHHRSETMSLHGEARGLDSFEIEIRQDLLVTAHGRERWAALVSAVLATTLTQLPGSPLSGASAAVQQ